MSSKSFVHLHAHTEYSILDGAARVEDVVAKAVRDGQPAAGITDHGTMSGVPEFYVACRKAGITPVLGIEAYMAFEAVSDRPAPKLKPKASAPTPKAEKKHKKKKGKSADSNDAPPATPEHGHGHLCDAPSSEAQLAAHGGIEQADGSAQIDGDVGGSDETGRKMYYHLVLLAETLEGYRNIAALSSRAYREGFYRKPRVDWDMLAQHSKGVIATTACLGGVVQQALLRGDYPEALGHTARLREIFGSDNLFVELQDCGTLSGQSDGIPFPEQEKTLPGLLQIAKDLGLPLLTTNDFHYVEHADAEFHDTLLCDQTRSRLHETDRFKFHGDQHYMKTAAEMRELFAQYEWAEAAHDNTLLIAERVKAGNLVLPFGTGEAFVPKFPDTPAGMTDGEYLRKLTVDGLAVKYGTVTDAILERADYELNVIEQMGFSSYFLIVWDIYEEARRNEIAAGPGRGSVGGCIVAYALRIHEVDPIKYDLLFERFLNPSRVSMPDIDMDFDHDRRGQLQEYTVKKYGRAATAQIKTFSRLKARGAVLAAARALQTDDPDDRHAATARLVSKAIPPNQAGRSASLAACLDPDVAKATKLSWAYAGGEALRQMVAADPVAREIVRRGSGLENLIKSSGLHAAGLIIGDRPLDEVLPTEDRPGAELPVAQFEMGPVEKLGLLKMDFLGLKFAAAIDRTLRLIAHARPGTPLMTLADIPLNDPVTYEMLARGETTGIFQLESSGMRELLRNLQPEDLMDMAAVVALYRPGPLAANMHNDFADRKNGRVTTWKSVHPVFDEVLSDTHGLMVYQESLMRVAQRLAGYSLAEADNLRKACGKKDKDAMKAERAKFVAACEAQGHGSVVGHKVFDIIEPFADYAFPKAHAVAYAYTSVRIAWLLAHYPAEAYAALISVFGQDKKKLAQLTAAARHAGVALLPPDINRSNDDMTVLPASKEHPKGALLFGFQVVRGVGARTASEIVRARDGAGGVAGSGPFTSLDELLVRVGRSALNSAAVKSLGKVGALRCFGYPDKAFDEAATKLSSAVSRAPAKAKATGKAAAIVAAAAAGDPKPKEFAEPSFEAIRDHVGSAEIMEACGPDDWTHAERLRVELDRLSQFVSVHPLDHYRRGAKRRSAPWAELVQADGSKDGATVAGYVASVKPLVTKKGKNPGQRMCAFELETADGEQIEVVVFPRSFDLFGHLIQPLSPIVVTGTVEVEVLEALTTTVSGVSDGDSDEDADSGIEGEGAAPTVFVKILADMVEPLRLDAPLTGRPADLLPVGVPSWDVAVTGELVEFVPGDVWPTEVVRSGLDRFLVRSGCAAVDAGPERLTLSVTGSVPGWLAAAGLSAVSGCDEVTALPSQA